MKKLTGNMKQMLDALAFADAGEYLTRRGKSRVLGQMKNPAAIAPATPEPATLRARSTARRVAFPERSASSMILFSADARSLRPASAWESTSAAMRTSMARRSSASMASARSRSGPTKERHRATW